LILYDLPYGALTQLYAGTTAEGAKLNGKVSFSAALLTKPVLITLESILFLGLALDIPVQIHKTHSRDESFGTGLRNRLRMFNLPP